MKKKLNLCILFGVTIVCGKAHGQTFFETADGDGIIAIRNETLSQIKINAASTAITYGYYYTSNNAKGKKGGLVLNVEAKAKPNDEGLATLTKTGKLQPGFGVNGAIGYRFNNIKINSKDPWNALDIYVKPEWSYNGYSIYDTTLVALAQEPLYKINKGSFKISLAVDFGTMLYEKMNLFIGLQLGHYFTNNASEMDDVTVQTTTPYPGSANKVVFSDIEAAKIGSLENVTKNPLSADLILDPGLPLGTSKTTKLGVFTYFRTDGKDQKFRNGLGICFLSTQNPSKVYTSLGYEFPTYGKDVTSANKKQDKGTVFATIGFSIN